MFTALLNMNDYTTIAPDDKQKANSPISRKRITKTENEKETFSRGTCPQGRTL